MPAPRLEKLPEALLKLSVQSTLADAPRGQGDWVEPKFALFVLSDISNDV
jgi:hypothetical protein